MIKEPNKKTVMLVAGIVCLVTGISCILAWWPDVVSLFKGAISVLLALAGIVLLYIVRL